MAAISRPFHAALPLAMVLIASVACSSTPPASQDVTPVAVPQVRDWRWLNFRAPDEQRSLLIADQLLISECMKKQGYKFRPTIPPRETEPDYPHIDGDDISARQQRGYDPDPRMLQKQPEDPNTDYIAKLSESERKQHGIALTGDGDLDLKVTFANGDKISSDSDGCLAESTIKLYGDQQQLLRVQVLAINVDAEAMARARKDSAYLSKVGEWSSCMAQKSLNYKTPEEALNDVLKKQPGQDATAARKREMLVAVADATCSKRVGLSETERRLTGAYIDKVARERHVEVSKFTQMRTRALQIATKLMRKNNIS